MSIKENVWQVFRSIGINDQADFEIIERAVARIAPGLDNWEHFVGSMTGSLEGDERIHARKALHSMRSRAKNLES
jgi:hypothetical protein